MTENENQIAEFDIISEEANSEEVISFDFSATKDDKKYLLKDIKLRLRLFRKFLYSLKKKKSPSSFKEILYVSSGEIPNEYISHFRQQYPDKEIKVLIPLDDKQGYKKLNLDFEFYLQNHVYKASVYKMVSKYSNIVIYGIYSDAFSGCDRSKFPYLVSYLKTARIVAKKLKPDIVHAYNIPFLLGCEFEQRFPSDIKIFQIFGNISEYDYLNLGAFGTAVSIADKKGIEKIFKDKIIRKNIDLLLKQQNVIPFSLMEECVDYVCENYYKLPENEGMETNAVINKLNARTLKLFPKMNCEKKFYHDILFNSFKKSNFWAVPSQTYYNTLLGDSESQLYEIICKTKERSSFVTFGSDKIETELHSNFTQENFRFNRLANKKFLIREFSKARIRIKFVDLKLFKGEEYTIRGYLDSMFDTPLIFCKFSTDIFKCGADIALTVLLKLLEQNKNIQIIINIPNGLENERIQSMIKYMEEKHDFDGKWVFINDEVNLPYFYSASDLTLFPAIDDMSAKEHCIALQYGCIPIVSKSGIFNDTIIDIFDDILQGCGFKVSMPLETSQESFENFYNAVEKALNIYTNNHAGWNSIIENALKNDTGWRFDVIEKYNNIYESLCK